MRFFVYLKKEFLLLSRDLHALALLFLMPTLFILIMSLALQDTFSGHTDVQVDYLLDDRDGGVHARWLIERLEASTDFQQADNTGSVEQQQALIQSDKAQFLLVVPAGYSDALSLSPADAPPLSIQVAPSTQRPTVVLFESWIRENLGQLFIHLANEAGLMTAGMPTTDTLKNAVKLQADDADQDVLLPTSVQQNVPAWLVFSMFFIAIPISTTLLAERAQGTLSRLKTLGVSKLEFLTAKLMTYIVVNLAQVVLMFMVGVWVVPLLGGDSLNLGTSPGGLFVIALATSFASVSFALLVANLANTTEQATILAGVSNIILAAIGGVMVPRFVMPDTMQNFSMLSPHAWGLEGFLDIILRGGDLSSVLPEALYLYVFGMLMMLGATFLMGRKQ